MIARTNSWDFIDIIEITEMVYELGLVKDKTEMITERMVDTAKEEIRKRREAARLEKEGIKKVVSDDQERNDTPLNTIDLSKDYITELKNAHTYKKDKYGLFGKETLVTEKKDLIIVETLDDLKGFPETDLAKYGVITANTPEPDLKQLRGIVEYCKPKEFGSPKNIYIFFSFDRYREAQQLGLHLLNNKIENITICRVPDDLYYIDYDCEVYVESLFDFWIAKAQNLTKHSFTNILLSPENKHIVYELLLNSDYKDRLDNLNAYMEEKRWSKKVKNFNKAKNLILKVNRWHNQQTIYDNIQEIAEVENKRTSNGSIFNSDTYYNFLPDSDFKKLAALIFKAPTVDEISNEILSKYKIFYTEKNGFYIYDDTNWHKVTVTFIKNLIREQFGKNFASHTRIRDTVEAIQQKAYIDDEELIFNKKPTLVFKNGTYYLDQKEFKECFNPDDLVSVRLNYNYDPKAKCPNFIEYLDLITAGDEELKQNIIKFLGWLFIPNNDLQLFFVIKGDTGTGKSTLAKVIEGLVGSKLCSHLKLRHIQKGDFHLVDIKDKYVNLDIDERNPDLRIIPDQFMELIDGSTIRDGYKGKDNFEFTHRCKPVMITNKDIKTDNAPPELMRRMRIIELNKVQFLDEPEKENQIQRDPKYYENKLAPELAGIFNLALEGFYKIETEGIFTETQQSKEYKEELVKQNQIPYFIRTKLNTILGIVFDTDSKVGSKHKKPRIYKEEVKKLYKDFIVDENISPQNQKEGQDMISEFTPAFLKMFPEFELKHSGNIYYYQLSKEAQKKYFCLSDYMAHLEEIGFFN